ETFSHVSPKEQAYLQKFAFLCELCFDIYLKKHIVEKLIDELPDSSQRAKDLATAKKARAKKK
ncbi:MAG: hypothetical protein K6A30_07480, partial [Lachnospiraceae bacterium]|nr:hypothetical protein [Lachnospiraceae bacterium]